MKTLSRLYWNHKELQETTGTTGPYSIIGCYITYVQQALIITCIAGWEMSIVYQDSSHFVYFTKKKSLLHFLSFTLFNNNFINNYSFITIHYYTLQSITSPPTTVIHSIGKTSFTGFPSR